MKQDLFDKYEVKINYAQAKRLMSLISEYIDFSKMTVGDVLDLEMVRSQLQEIIDAEETNYDGR